MVFTLLKQVVIAVMILGKREWTFGLLRCATIDGPINPKELEWKSQSKVYYTVAQTEKLANYVDMYDQGRDKA